MTVARFRLVRATPAVEKASEAKGGQRVAVRMLSSVLGAKLQLLRVRRLA